MSLDVSIVAEQGLPYDLVHGARDQITSEIERALGQDVAVSVENGALSMSADGGVHWSDSVAQTSSTNDISGTSGIVLFVTELPRLWRGQPVPVEIDTSRSAGIISVPAAGSVFLRRKTVRLVVAAIAELSESNEVSAAASTAVARRLQWLTDEEHPGKSALVTSERMGRLRMVMGMARVNRPWRLVSTLKGVMAAAAATASFGIFYTSIWSMSAALSTRRLAMIMVLSMVMMTVWLIMGNRLWESKSYDKVWRRLYNASTLATVLTGVVTMYVCLFVLALLAGLVVIDPAFMSQQLSGSASITNYLVLAWLSTSMGVIAGALGSSADSYDAILRATFGNRERERRMADEEPEE